MYTHLSQLFKIFDVLKQTGLELKLAMPCFQVTTKHEQRLHKFI